MLDLFIVMYLTRIAGIEPCFVKIMIASSGLMYLTRIAGIEPRTLRVYYRSRTDVSYPHSGN